MTQLSHILCIGFDWDGTLVDSVFEKARAYAQVFIYYYNTLSDIQQELEQFYITVRGKPRRKQFKMGLARFLGIRVVPEDELQNMERLFVEIYAPRVPPLFDDAISTIRELRRRGYKIFISTGMPEEDLKKVLPAYQIDKRFFDEILGSRAGFSKGIDHFHYISFKYQLAVQAIAYVGDSPEDVKAAKTAQVTPILKKDTRLSWSDNEEDILVINELKDLLSLFLPDRMG